MQQLMIRKVDGEDFETPISEQGSGVRSLACLVVDIPFSDNKIVLIDEPELGLNPLVKQEFLKFLLTESKERQIFIATQDTCKSMGCTPNLYQNTCPREYQRKSKAFNEKLMRCTGLLLAWLIS